VEQAIANVWKKQFGFDKIGIRDDFFELGGDSLKAISLISKIHKELNGRIQLNAFFSNPTVEALAQFITGAQTSEGQYVSITPVEKREYYVCSSTQKRLYILNQMENTDTSYNLLLLNQLQGEIDKERLEEVFRILIKRHESFRTSIEIAAEEAVQRVYDEVEFEIEYHDLQVTGTGDRRREEAGLIHSFIRPLDLSRAPLLRIGLIKTDEANHILLFDMHHVITDGISQNILINEFNALYWAKALPPLRLQYKDFSMWQSSQNQQESIKKQESYWLKELAGDIPVLDLPVDYARPAVFSFEGGAVDTELTGEETKTLNEIARSEGATLYMVLLAAYNIFLSKITGQEDILVGTPTAGRSHTDLEPIIGMFVNTLALRGFPAANKTLEEFLHEIKESTLKAFENQDYPFENLV
jgi:acyl carrier protein